MILIALGANLPSRYGTPGETLAAAKEALEARNITILQSSQTWLTAPVPVSDQPWYHNEVVSVATDITPFRLLDVLQEIENEFGRIRTVRNAPRVLDLDLIAYNDEILDRPELIVPHPRMHKRAFVLRPMQELTNHWVHPVLQMTLDDLIMNLPDDQEVIAMTEKQVATL